MNTIKKLLLPLIGTLVLVAIAVMLWWWKPFASETSGNIVSGNLLWIISGLILVGIGGTVYVLIERMKQVSNHTSSKTDQADIKDDADDAVLESGIALKSIFNQIDDAICVLDRDFNIMEINQAWLKTFNLNKENVLGKKCYKVLYNREKLCKNCPAISAFKSGNKTEAEKSTISSDGNIEYFDVQTVPILNKEGNVTQVVNYTRDITEYIKTEKELCQINDRFEAIIEAIPDAIYFKDVKNDNLIVNSAYEELAELKLEENDEDASSPDLAKHWQKTDKQVIEEGKSIRTKDQVIDKEGKELFLDTIKVPLYDDQKNVIGVLGISRDITEHKKEIMRKLKRVEDVTAREKLKFSTLLSSVDESILLADNQDRVVEVNNQFASFLGMEPESILGKTLFSLYSENGTVDKLRKTIKKFHQQSGTESRHSDVEIEYSSSDGDATLRMQPIYKDDTEYQGTLIIAAQSKTEQSKATETEYTANTDETGIPPVKLAQASTDEVLTEVIDEITAPIKIETDRFGIEIVNSDLQTNVEDMVESLVRRVYREEGSELAMDINLKSSETPLDYDNDVDEVILYQTLLNIFGNVIKYTEEGKANIRTNVLSKKTHSNKQTEQEHGGHGKRDVVQNEARANLAENTTSETSSRAT